MYRAATWRSRKYNLEQSNSLICKLPVEHNNSDTQGQENHGRNSSLNGCVINKGLLLSMPWLGIVEFCRFPQISLYVCECMLSLLDSSKIKIIDIYLY